MTTKMIIENDHTSNGDVLVSGVNVTPIVDGAYGLYGIYRFSILPGERVEFGITTSSAMFVTETWPTVKPKEQPQENQSA